MSKLRQAFHDEITLRGYSERTRQSYEHALEQLSNFVKQSLSTISDAQLQRYFRHLSLNKKLVTSSILLQLNAVQFLYKNVLHQSFNIHVCWPKKPQKIPELLSKHEVQQVISHVPQDKFRVMLMLAYACGLRSGELIALKVSDIDGERQTLKIRNGKGGKDRFVVISPSMLTVLRQYWCQFRPYDWLFPSRRGRHFGFLANRCRRKKLKVIKAQCTPPENTNIKPTTQAEINWPCPECQHGILRLHGLALPDKIDNRTISAPPFRLTT